MSAINQDRTLALVYENTKEILSIIKSQQTTTAISSGEDTGGNAQNN